MVSVFMNSLKYLTKSPTLGSKFASKTAWLELSASRRARALPRSSMPRADLIARESGVVVVIALVILLLVVVGGWVELV